MLLMPVFITFFQNKSFSEIDTFGKLCYTFGKFNNSR
nr:MAG TPA: hypothetical protein [Caudoviricetes sp.]